ncbi:MAG: hypothetical protein OQK82_00050 [Candidatus Pacearchaeota archaeon]|nr:hypothetical protein [Candidatus Pacearchaeota archaeon]
MRPETEKILNEYVKEYGEQSLVEKLIFTKNEDHALTIIANAGVHPYHELHTRGEVFVASNGSLDFSTALSAHEEIERVLIRVSKKLTEKRWKKVYLVPFGPAPLSLQIKSLVHKVLDIETIDILHIGSGEHIDIQLDPRRIAIKAGVEL